MAERRSRRPAAWMSVALVSLIALVVVVLSVLALQRAQNTSHGGEVAPVPTFDLGVTAGPSASDGSSPAPTSEVPQVEPVERSAERFLAASDAGVLWRGIAGSCTEEVTPTLERSDDGGSTWNEVTPLYQGITQLSGIDATTGAQAAIVAAFGADCAVQGMRTFTDGQFWEPYEDVLGSFAFIEPADATQVVMSGTAVEAPCDDARGARSAGDQVVLICSGDAERLVDGEWASLGIGSAVALTVVDDGLVVAHASDECNGIALSTVRDDGEIVPAGCSEGLDASSSTAIASTGEGVAMWNGEEFTVVQLDG